MKLSGRRCFSEVVVLLCVSGLLTSSWTINAVAAPSHKPLAVSRSTDSMDDVAVVDRIIVNDSPGISATVADVELTRAGETTPGGIEIGSPVRFGDTLKTKDGDQVVLKFASSSPDVQNLVYLDPNTEVVIGSLCLKSGRILAWVGIDFKVCLPNRTLSVHGTEFEVTATDQGKMTVAVLNGVVDVTPRGGAPNLNTALDRRPPVVNERTVRVGKKMELTILPDDTTQEKPIPESQGKALINYWSNQMIKAEAPRVPKETALLNFQSDQTRNQEFLEARFDAVWNERPSSLEKVGKVYNDWGQGGRALTVLNAAARQDSQLLASSSFQVNLAEADRQLGKYESAKSHLDIALSKDKDSAEASYIMARVLLDRDKKTEGSQYAEAARGFLAKSLQAKATAGTLNRDKAEQELDAVLKKQGQQFLEKQTVITSDRWWREKKMPNGVEYSGSVNLPELNKVGIDASGPAKLYIVGNQFKLTTESDVLTGTIVGTTTEGYTSVALRFDDPRVASSLKGISLSLRSQHKPGALLLEDTQRGQATINMGVVKPFER